VQISVDDGPFTNLYQMQGDMIYDLIHLQSYFWITSPYLDLSPFAGKTIRVRFHFDPLDREYNSTPGWWVDDVTINSSAPDLSCAEAVPNDTPAQASPVGTNATIQAKICPAGDLDYYSFTVPAGKTISFDIDARSLAPASSLDSILSLVDTDGKNILAENDDEISWIAQDSFLSYTFQRGGTYYVRVKSWSHPGTGGSNYFYTLKIIEDNQLPEVHLTFPGGNWIPPTAFNFIAQAFDGDNGLARVDFYWHSANWAQDGWELIASDTNGTDGWQAAFDPTQKSIPGSALLIKAVDRGGLYQTAVYWDLQTDTIAPTSRLNLLAANTLSTVIPLSWTASDPIGEIQSFEIQYMLDGSGTWQAWNPPLAGTVRSAFFIAQDGHTYGFTIRSTDKAGNIENFASTAETSTVVADTCTPDEYDASGGDNSAPPTVSLPLGTAQEHNICPANDEDWAALAVNAPGSYLVRGMPRGSGVAVILEVSTQAGQMLAQLQSPGLGLPTDLRVDFPAAGTYRVRVRALSASLWGTDFKYNLWAGPRYWEYLPTVR
jgi:hypothetical protein